MVLGAGGGKGGSVTVVHRDGSSGKSLLLWPRDDARTWIRVGKFTTVGAALADGHYSRRTVGSPQFMPPGQTVVLVSGDEASVFGWWRPHPASGIKAMNNLDGWTCTIFRRTGGGACFRTDPRGRAHAG